MNSGRKYVPKPYGLDRDFFHKAIEGGVHVQRCQACGHNQHPPRYFCGACASRDLAFEPATGNATVYSWTVSHFTTDPGWMDELPYATVVAELDEGVRLVGSYSGEIDELEIGKPVTVRVEQKSDDFAYIWLDPV